MSSYDISRAFKRIENDLMDSMMRNLKRHQAEETELGFEWEQWQALQLKELERYRKENADKFTDDFSQINKKVEAMFKATCNDAQSKQENYILEQIKKGDFTPTQTKDTQFFNLNDDKLNLLIERTKSDFSRAEYAMLRQADDMYRQIIFDAQVYANVTNDYAKAVDMATKDFLMKGIQCVTYKNGAKHNIADYAEMAIRTGNKRAYLMGEGNAHDKYGIHTVRVNKRTQACPKCVGFLGRVLVDDVYCSGTAKEASELGVPTLSSAIQAGFLHPNCKDIYSLYIPDISKPPKPWTQAEINKIVGDYNKEQAITHAVAMAESYRRLSKYALDPTNAQLYGQRADIWEARATELGAEPPKPVEVEPPIEPPAPPAEPPKPIKPEDIFTDDEKEALEWYVSGDGMWINQYLRGVDVGGLSEDDKRLLALLESATSKELPPIDKLYRSVDASVIFSDLSENELYEMTDHLIYGDSAYDKGAYSQSIKKRMESALNNAKGKTLTEKGFMSTTIDKTVAEEFGGFTGAEHPVVIELDTKGKKLKGADVTFLDIEEDPQKEWLLAKDTQYKINDIVVATDADGGKYIKVKAEIVGQGAEVAEEVVATVPDALQATENAEDAIRKEMAGIKDAIRAKQAEVAEAEKLKQDIVGHINTYQNNKAWADMAGSNVVDELTNALKDAENNYANNPSEINKFWVDRYKFILANIDAFENGTITADTYEATIKSANKEIKKLEKQLGSKYNDLEAVIGEPNVSKLAVYKEKNTTNIKHFLDDAPQAYRDVWNECADRFNPLPSTDRWGRRRKGAFYSASEDGVYLSISKVAKGDSLHPPYQTVFHEYGHNIDYVLNRIYGNGDTLKAFSTTYKDGVFGKTVAKEAEEAITKYGKEHGFLRLVSEQEIIEDADRMVMRKLMSESDKADYIAKRMASRTEIFYRRDAEKAFCKEIKDAFSLADRGDISDMFEPVMETAFPFGAGHGRSYWTKDGDIYIKHGKEAFAEMYSSKLANDASWELINKYFPESVKIFEEMLEVVKL